jgi:hypothetical protein
MKKVRMDEQEVYPMYYWNALEQSKNAQGLIGSLPTAKLVPIELEEAENTSGYHASVVGGVIVGMVTKKYALVQHAEAFMPIITALDNAGEEYQVSVWDKRGKAGLRVITGRLAADGVKLGFQVLNSVDGTTSINYNFWMNRQSDSHIEIVGYRLSCKNGMVMRVPLDEAEFVKPELKAQIQMLMKKLFSISHVGDAKAKAQQVQYIVEALTLLKEPVATMIEKSKTIGILPKEAEMLLAKYVGQRLSKKCLFQFRMDKIKEGDKLWSLYNAITYVASHDGVSDSSKKSLLDNSADMLNDVLTMGVAKAIEVE